MSNFFGPFFPLESKLLEKPSHLYRVWDVRTIGLDILKRRKLAETTDLNVFFSISGLTTPSQLSLIMREGGNFKFLV